MTRELRCDLTTDQLAAKSAALAQAEADLMRKEIDWKNKASTHRAEVKEMRERIRELVRDCQDKSETRMVECEELHDKAKREVRIVRKDTKEVIDSRPMTAAEREGHGLSKDARNVPAKEKGKRKAGKPATEGGNVHPISEKK